MITRKTYEKRKEDAMSPRDKAYRAINGERDYQDTLGSDRTDGRQRSVGDYVTMLQHYQNKLVETWTVYPGDEQALDVMRKIAGIAVHCMEDHGSIPRNTSRLKHKQ
jgi:hypothetical protein